MNRLTWSRKSAHSANDFDLVLENPQEADFPVFIGLLDAILNESHRGLTLSSRAAQEFRRWFEHPNTPLKSEAYVLLSNWFMTQSGDRHSMVASRCEALWDALFPCRPKERLSEPGRNHVIVPAQFENLWRMILEVRGEVVSVTDVDMKQQSRKGLAPETDGGSGSDPLKLTFDKDGLHFEVGGSPAAIAEFLKRV